MLGLHSISDISELAIALLSLAVAIVSAAELLQVCRGNSPKDTRRSRNWVLLGFAIAELAFALIYFDMAFEIGVFSVIGTEHQLTELGAYTMRGAVILSALAIGLHVLNGNVNKTIDSIRGKLSRVHRS